MTFTSDARPDLVVSVVLAEIVRQLIAGGVIRSGPGRITANCPKTGYDDLRGLDVRLFTPVICCDLPLDFIDQIVADNGRQAGPQTVAAAGAHEVRRGRLVPAQLPIEVLALLPGVGVADVQRVPGTERVVCPAEQQRSGCSSPNVLPRELSVRQVR